jgi:hypothetical protein
MANERNWLEIPSQLFISDGGQYGQVSIPSTVRIKVKQKVEVSSNLLPVQITLEVKSVINETDIILGPIATNIEQVTDLRSYTVASGAKLFVAKQLRNTIVEDVRSRSVYEEEPTLAYRSHLVDYLGRSYDASNPIPIRVEFDPVTGLEVSQALISKIDEASDTTTYIGKATAGSTSDQPLWQIQRVTVSGTETSIDWADGDKSFNNIWDDRGSLSYS